MPTKRFAIIIVGCLLGLNLLISNHSMSSAQQTGTALTPDNIAQAQEIERLGYGTLYATALHPSQNRVAIGSSSGWQIVTLPDLTRISFSQGYAGAVQALAWSPDGNLLLTGSQDGILRLWSPTDGTLLEKFPAHDEAILTLDWSTNGTWWVTGSADNTVKVWSAETAELSFRLQGHQNDVRAVAFSPDSNYLASASGGANASSDATVRLWEPLTGRYLTTLRGHQFGVNALIWSANSQTLYSGGYDGQLYAWNINNYTQANQWSFSAIYDLAWSPDQTQMAIVTGRGANVWDGSIILWNPTTDERQTITYREQNNIPLLSAVWHDNSLLAISEYYRQAIGVWNTDTLELVNELIPVDYRAYSFDWSPDSAQLAIATHEHGLRLWDIGLNTPETHLLGHDFERYWGVAWSPDGNFLASTLDGVRIWAMPGGEIWQDAKSHENAGFAYTPHWTATSDVVIYHLANGISYGVPLNADSPAGVSADVAPPRPDRHFSPDGSMVAQAQADGSIEIWSWDESTQLTTLWGHSTAVEMVRWSPAGQWLASLGEDGTLRIWGIK